MKIQVQDKGYAQVNIRESNEKKRVEIASKSKPEISKEVLEKWQSLL